MRELLTAALLAVGGLFMLLGAVGVVRMPDLYCRMQATAKSATLGLGCMMLAVAVYFGELGVVARAFIIVLFAFMTVPVGNHMIARAAIFLKVPMWRTTLNDLEGRYDMKTHECKSYLPKGWRAEDR
jgi:multicomponent Na+:H+ antiporter subunit G